MTLAAAHPLERPRTGTMVNMYRGYRVAIVPEHGSRGAELSKSPIEKAGILVAVIAPLVGVVVAIVQVWQRLVTPLDIGLLLGLYAATGLGITVGFHRMLTHRSFEAHPAVRALFLALGSMAVQGPALDWASNHIKHHAKTDTDEDPHSPLNGFIHAHVGWLFTGKVAEPEIYGRWMLKDPMVMFFSRTFLLWIAAGLLIPYAIDGWRGFVWGGLVRVFLLHHVTWSVNSVCHVFGKRDYDTPDRSTNQWIVGILAFGEGWHNNHHAFPRSAFHGLRWWQIDLSGYIIRLLERLGLAKRVWRPPVASIYERRAHAG